MVHSSTDGSSTAGTTDHAAMRFDTAATAICSTMAATFASTVGGCDTSAVSLGGTALSAALSMGRAEGRRVEYADALSHLESLADDSLAAVTLIQVIEHLPIPDQLTLYKTAARKLAPGGFIVVETINPSCLAALANAYLLDPSHRAPMHPQMTRFLMEQAGLWRVQIRLLRPVEEAGRLRQLPTLPGAGHEALNILNQDIIQLNEILFGAQDYAAIAYKPEEQEA